MITLELFKKGKLKITMKEYIDKIIDELSEMIERTASTPPANYLFQIRDETEASKLDEERAIVFHHIFTQLLFISGQARQHTQTGVAFLTTCIKNPD